MRILELTCCLSQLDAVVTLRPGPGDGSPEISWDDLFFYYSPDGSVPTTTQPFATIVTKDYPGFDESSRLDRPDTYRVNVAAGREAFIQWVGRAPRDPAAGDPSTPDPEHPTWSSRTRCTGELGWLCVVNPGPQTENTLLELLRTAYDLDRQRYRRYAR